MRIVAEAKTPFLHSRLGFESPSFTEMAMRRVADKHQGQLVYVQSCGLLLASGALSRSAEVDVQKLKGRTVF